MTVEADETSAKKSLNALVLPMHWLSKLTMLAMLDTAAITSIRHRILLCLMKSKGDCER